ncbi:DUF1800 domain-containing protein [Deinococcus deserti]|uniref:DUF1800 domain-containing protein n=1 Tax=Deinococcus deserti (strain DSM 17065 / CIP 109153 / LMG 22923 / VCD115) TaxID=546414 RepID=C1CXQ5_DEIDV|nr:DUF1800 domain-containing protein [Deinococcus deserti]ACO44861.1 hypothetical protein Deide_00640 [Deinococcus deserti VCD115]
MSLTPYTRPLSAEDAAHFLRRTAFGATDAQIRALAGKDARAVARHHLNFGQDRASGNPFDPAQAATPFAGVQLTRAAWLYELLYGPHPLRELLTLTWSNHFVVGTDKVRNVPVLAEYLALLRRHAATTDFARFTLEVAQSPAMLRYLDADQNRKGRPNENFSRELLELFTTGIGPYTEKDVQEGARALTGWTFRGGRGNQKFLEASEYFFISREHDGGRKTYLGQSGNLRGEDVVRIAATHPATAAFVARKLHRAFIADEPDPAAVAASAETFRRTHGNVRAVLEELLASDHFYTQRASIIRGPVAFIVGALRTLGQPPLEPKQLLNLAQTAGKMGQFLLQPDTVKGWDGGREWINDTALLTRMQVAASLTLSGNAPKLETAPTPLALLGRETPLPGTERLNDRQRTYLTLISPEFQLA